MRFLVVVRTFHLNKSGTTEPGTFDDFRNDKEIERVLVFTRVSISVIDFMLII